MKFVESPLPGAFVIEIEPNADERGFFARTFCENEFRAHGLEPVIAQCSISYNTTKGTLRGMHYQAAPYQEAKVVRCLRGAVVDVIVDLRPASPTYCRWTSVELTAENRLALYVPKDLAHGFQTLVDDTELFYQMSEPYVVSAARGVRWNDPAFGIEWPLAHPILSDRDAAFPDFQALVSDVRHASGPAKGLA